MRIIAATVAAIGFAAFLGGCNRADSPAQVSNNVSDARQQAASDVASTLRAADKSVQAEHKDLDKAYDSANAQVADKARDVTNAQVQGNYDVTIAKAEGEDKIAKEKCQALNGSSQKACKDRADDTLNVAKANANAARTRQKL